MPPAAAALIRTLYAEHGLKRSVIVKAVRADFPSLSASQVEGVLYRLHNGSPTNERPAAAQEAKPGDDALASPLTPAPITLDELLALFGLDGAEWEAFEATPNIYHVGAKHPETGEILVEPLYQLKARVRRRAGASLAAFREALVADIREETKLRARITHRPPTAPESELHCLGVDVFDVHLGKLAWAEEVGENYDTKIAAEAVQSAVSDLLWQARAYKIEQVVIPIGNDFFNADNLVGTTTGGTRQDVDTRFHLMFRRGFGLASWMIHECAKLAPVVVPVVPGNHDRQSSFCLGVALEAAFGNDPRVTIDNSARVRKYVTYGRNLLGFTHGDEEKLADLPQLMATEVPQLWAAATHREFHVGHFHHLKERSPFLVDDKTGATVRLIRSLSGSDRWHSGRGYVSRRGAEAFVFRKTGGLRAHLFTYPASPLEQAG
jgi:hypothetical protein